MCGDMLCTHQLWKRKNNSVRKMTSPRPIWQMRCCDCCNLRCNQRMSQIVGIPNKQKKQTHHVIATMLAMYRVQAVSRSSKSPLSSRLLRHSHQTVEHCSLCHIAIQTSKNPRCGSSRPKRHHARQHVRVKRNNRVDTLNTSCCVCCACCGVAHAVRCGKVWHALMLLGYTLGWVPYTVARWDTVW